MNDACLSTGRNSSNTIRCVKKKGGIKMEKNKDKFIEVVDTFINFLIKNACLTVGR